MKNYVVLFTLSLTVLLNTLSLQAAPLDWIKLQSKLINDSNMQFVSQLTDEAFGNNKDASQPIVFPTEGQFQQKLDHDNASDSQTFKQRYWYLKSYPDNAPVLFYVCGEGSCGSYALRGVMASHAAALKANLIALEHRYYGESQPFGDLSTEHLKYLTVNYALKDILNFQSFAQKNLKFAGSWIAVGGSYPGSLAAYLRANYPNNFVGALASSGPVQAENNFYLYDKHVAVQAGPECLNALQNVVHTIDTAQPQEFVEIKKKFSAESLKDDDDFIYLIADTAAASIQYGYKESFCKNIVSSGIEGYVQSYKQVSMIFGDLVDFSAQAAEDISLANAKGGIGMRQWFYQSCTEFGFWQNANPDNSLRARSTRINESYHRNLCKRLFNFDQFANTDQTNAAYYNPILKSASNILFTNGSEDPWLNLSINEETAHSNNPMISAYLIQDAAHCSDLTQEANAQQAKALFIKNAKTWLKLN